MAHLNNKKATSTVDKKYTTNKYTANYFLLSSKNFRKKTTKSFQKTMTRTNTHRKNRNSREICCKETQETFHISSVTVAHPQFPSSSSSSYLATSIPSASAPSTIRIKYRLWEILMIILMLTLLDSTKLSYAIAHSSHSKLQTTASMMATTTTPPMARETATSASIPASKYSQPLKAEGNNDDSFRPIIPKDINLEAISQNVFTKDGQYRVFEPIDSDLRATLAMKQTNYNAMDVSTLPAHNLATFSEPSEVVTLQSKRKALLTEKQEAVNGKKSVQQTIEEKNMSIKTERTHTTLLEGKPNHFKPELRNAHVLQQHILPSNKQWPPNAVRPLTANETTSGTPTGNIQGALTTEINGLENLLTEYVDNFFNKGQYQPKPELIIALQQNVTEMKQAYEQKIGKYVPVMEKNRPIRQALEKRADGELSVNIPRAFESGRLLFFAGLKKVMWPIYMGLQVLKSLMFALLLPTLIGSFGKLLGKGISSGSAPLFIRPMDEPQDLDFRDNNFNFDDDSNKFTLIDDAAAAVGGDGNVKDTGYAYNQAEASQKHNQYAYNAASINQQAFSRYGMNERQQLMQDSYLSALQSLGAASFKNSVGLSGSSSGGGGLAGLASPVRQKPVSPANTNTFQQFQKVPASSLLLSNYDPFYSPLLSRLDSVFAQLKLKSDDEACREKLICLMYANPAKYAPYSNLVSAQLSRELNELRKPTSDNPDILRFFKYMRAAKDGQDGIDCEISFDKCKEFKDFENPAMVSTYHDINKLVQARKFS